MQIFHHKSASGNLSRLAGLAHCAGIRLELFKVQDSAAFISALEQAMLLQPELVVLDAGSLQGICSQEDLDTVTTIVFNHKISVLLLITEADEGANRFVRVLTRDGVLGGKLVDKAAHVNFPEGASGLAGELVNQSYPRKPVEAIGLTLGSGPEVECIMKLDDFPAFVRVQAGAANVFVWSSSRIFDVFRPLSAEKEFEEAVDEYVPAIILLRFACRDQCWRNPNPGAGIVIDDPLLKKNYGFIDFPQLLKSARSHNYHVTLAFIPWNHWRSRVANARMFLKYSDCFSVCAHGCDHTNREFGSSDYEDLLSRNFVARERMERHCQRTGLACEPLMVCPQEQYSLEAMRAFADSRQFIGLVCTACMPRNLAAPSICGADLLLPAQDSFFGFPVFKRHYWSDMPVFAMALFLGKPAILVEHHEFFRDGPAAVEAFVSGLPKLHPQIQWTSLAETAARTHLRRRLTENRFEVRFFTDAFKLEHEDEMSMEYRLLRRIPATTIVRRVTVNGVETPFVREDDLLAFEVRADAPQVFQVQVEVAPIKPAKEYSAGIKYHASVAFRRGLSEFRDNVIARNDFLLRAARSLAKKMKQTSG